jgi:tripartite-type tricarboxylate transporter receptor subunit TctC
MLNTLAFVSFICFSLTSAHAQTPFYQGKTITVIVSTSPGGTGDLRVKALVPFLRKHIPGNPSLVLEYMDGGGGRKGANHLFRGARADGLVIGAMSSSVISLNVMRESGVLYDLDKFIYLGAPESVGHQVLYTRKELGTNSLEKLKAKSGLRIGAQSVGHVSYVAGRLFAYLLDLKDTKFIAGFTAPELDAALLRGELDSRANAAVSVLRRNPDWLDKGIMDFHAIMEIPTGVKHARLSHLPEIESFVKNDREKKLLGMWKLFRQVGSPYMAPPGTPKDRVDILQEAMRRALNDSEFHREFLKLVGDEVEPLLAGELTKLVKNAPRDAETIDLLKVISGAGALPPR